MEIAVALTNEICSAGTDGRVIPVDIAVAKAVAIAKTVREALHKSHLSAQLGTLHGSPTCELDLVQRLTVAGDVQSCRDAIDRLAASGADSIVLQPIHGAEEQQIDAFAHAGLLSGQQTPTAHHRAAMRHAAEAR